MGAKTWMMVYADADPREVLAARPSMDREATRKLAAKLFPKEKLEPLDDGSLSYTCPPSREICIGCFPGVAVVAADEFGIDYPSRLPARLITAAGTKTATLHAMHSVVDWFAYARWIDGELVRSLSVAPDNGVIEDIGKRLDFEEPYWNGEQPAVEDDEEYPLPFHSLELGEAALLALFGYQLEGYVDSWLFDPEEIALARYRRSRPFWRFW